MTLPTTAPTAAAVPSLALSVLGLASPAPAASSTREAGETADFASLLGAQTAAAAAPAQISQIPAADPAAESAATAPLTTLPEDAVPLPAPGKILPQAPADFAVVLAERMPAPASQPVPDTPPAPKPAVEVAAPTPIRAAKPGKAAKADEPDRDEPAPAPGSPVADARPIMLPVTFGPVSQQSAEAPKAAQSAASSGAPVHAAPAAQPAPAPHAAASRSEPETREQPRQEAAFSAHRLGELARTAPTDIAPPVIQPVIADTAAPMAQPQQAPASIPVAAPAAVNLAQVVDAIARARAEAQPQAVHMAVRHAEFGTVSLRFEHRAGDLSVSLSSPDPDFARAVSAATAPDGSTFNSDASGARASQDQPGAERSFRAASDGQPQQQSQRGRAEQGPAVRANASPQAASGDEAASDDIFA